MSDTGWFLVIALSALALASMSVRGVVSMRGVELGVYVGVLVLCAGAGCGIAAAIDDTHVVLGGVVGVACVEVGPFVARLVRQVAGRLAKKVGE